MLVHVCASAGHLPLSAVARAGILSIKYIKYKVLLANWQTRSAPVPPGKDGSPAPAAASIKYIVLSIKYKSQLTRARCGHCDNDVRTRLTDETYKDKV